VQFGDSALVPIGLIFEEQKKFSNYQRCQRDCGGYCAPMFRLAGFGMVLDEQQ